MQRQSSSDSNDNCTAFPIWWSLGMDNFWIPHSQHNFEKQTISSLNKLKKKSPFRWGEVTGGGGFGKHQREEAFLAWLEKNRESMVSTNHNNETCVSKQVKWHNAQCFSLWLQHSQTKCSGLSKCLKCCVKLRVIYLTTITCHFQLAHLRY
jgi:hypothetical protein